VDVACAACAQRSVWPTLELCLFALQPRETASVFAAAQVVVTEATLAAAEAARAAGRSTWRVSSTVFTHCCSDALLRPLGRFGEQAAGAEASRQQPQQQGQEQQQEAAAAAAACYPAMRAGEQVRRCLLGRGYCWEAQVSASAWLFVARALGHTVLIASKSHHTLCPPGNLRMLGIDAFLFALLRTCRAGAARAGGNLPA
jgi:hypothetical protein